MTIACAWIRRVGKVEELVFCTDSRLRSYGSWDANPKIFTFERTDCAICFSGDTLFSYPLMIQLKNLIDADPKARSRFERMDVFQSRLVKTINSLLSHKSDYELPKVNFLFGGYCWFRKAFRIWIVEFNKTEKRFRSRLLTSGAWTKGDWPIFFVGDYTQDIVNLVRSRLLKSSNFKRKNHVDMEPFQSLCDMLLSPAAERNHHLIGGPAQLLKVYRSLNRVPFGVKWVMNELPETTLFGMPMFSGRRFRFPIIDPNTLQISNSQSFK